MIGTLDTKGREAAFLADRIRSLGFHPTTLDLALRSGKSFTGDVSREEVLAAGGGARTSLDRQTREAAMESMARGAGVILRRLTDDGSLLAAVAIGGSKGTWMATAAMRELPWGLPKVMVASTVAGDLRRYTGHRDIVFMPSAVDLSGLNRMTRTVLSRAAAVVCALVRADGWPAGSASAARSVAVSTAGIVTPCGLRVQELLEAGGFEPIVFPANGAGGRALEETAESGAVIGVIDLAAMELSNELLGGVCSAGPHRMETAGRLGLPQVVVPGAVEIANFPRPDGPPARYRRRRQLAHTPAITLIRLTARESRRVGETMGRKLRLATGPTTVVIPKGGFSAYDHPGEPFWDPVADRAFIDGLKSMIGPTVSVEERPEHVNDHSFADAIIEAFERGLHRSAIPMPSAGTLSGAREGAR